MLHVGVGGGCAESALKPTCNTHAPGAVEVDGLSHRVIERRTEELVKPGDWNLNTRHHMRRDQNYTKLIIYGPENGLSSWRKTCAKF